MSSLARFASLTARVAAVRTTTPAFTAAGSRFISSTPKNEKGPVEATKETLKKADRVISDNLVKGIDKGVQGGGMKEDLKGEASEKAGETKGKAEETLGEVKGKAKEVYGEAKGKAKEMGNV
ncbi:LEA domain protein [Aspergillus novofumigatus IBT 16806]|uniref:LEA domain protein n=1 Tax=Aspergillus novofumigatus (strain IBT 16806) TaxID=1392255 RepID=A0A2I1C3F9_ASPN1|nr:LEA domain protein [Aspergillus novofumigatus IBT 16806]PKX92177.1 LEA domain protein [Aspergillus novofumigatus IBT 16806]